MKKPSIVRIYPEEESDGDYGCETEGYRYELPNKDEWVDHERASSVINEMMEKVDNVLEEPEGISLAFDYFIVTGQLFHVKYGQWDLIPDVNEAQVALYKRSNTDLLIREAKQYIAEHPYMDATPSTMVERGIIQSLLVVVDKLKREVSRLHPVHGSIRIGNTMRSNEHLFTGHVTKSVTMEGDKSFLVTWIPLGTISPRPDWCDEEGYLLSDEDARKMDECVAKGSFEGPA